MWYPNHSLFEAVTASTSSVQLQLQRCGVEAHNEHAEGPMLVLCRICIFSIGALFRFLARDMESSNRRILFSESCSWEETMDSRFSRLYGSPLMKVARYITALKLYISQIGASPVPYQVTNCSHSLSIFSKLWLRQRASPLPPAGFDRKHHSPKNN